MTNEYKEQLIKDILALKQACSEYHNKHSGGPGGAAICICGHACGGSAACNGLGMIRNLLRYHDPSSSDWEERRDIIAAYL
jgi:hypothetical protein